MVVSRRRGFTLIELLVVIAIIAVLIALLAARRAVGPRGGPAVPVHQQPEADRPGDAQLPPVGRYCSRWATRSRTRPSARRRPGALSAPADALAVCGASDRFTTHATSSWAVWYGAATAINMTVWNTKVAAFLCPSDHTPARFPQQLLWFLRHRHQSVVEPDQRHLRPREYIVVFDRRGDLTGPRTRSLSSRA